jgi:hypothetical protein
MIMQQQQLTVLHNRDNQSWTQWFLDSRLVKGGRWFLGTNFFDIVCNASFAGMALAAAIATGGWLPILFTIVTTTILVTSICRTIVDAHVIKRSQENCLPVIEQNEQSTSISNIAVHQRDSVPKVIEPNKKLYEFDKINSVLYNSMNLFYVFLIVGLPLIGIGMGLLGVVIPALASIPPITTAVGGIIFGFKCVTSIVTTVFATKALSTQKLEERKNFVLRYQPSENKVSKKNTNTWISALFDNQTHQEKHKTLQIL